jgi:hypothetical protein
VKEGKASLFSYFAYGLGIQSSLEIPEFIPAQRDCDLTLIVDTLQHPHDHLLPDIIDQPWMISLSRARSVLYIKEVGVFLIERGEMVTVILAPNVSDPEIRFYLVGTVMAIVLFQRGLLVLHASAVSIDGGVIAFLGVSGQGKSSTAAAFHAQSYSILTDDVAPVTVESEPPTITPGFPQIKLGPETAKALGYDFDALLTIHASDEKRGYRFSQDFPVASLPIHALYVLEDGETFKIDRINPREAMIELTRHSRPTTLFHAPDAIHFQQCAALAKQAGIYRLQRPRNLALLPELVRIVVEHVADITKLNRPLS